MKYLFAMIGFVFYTVQLSAQEPRLVLPVGHTLLVKSASYSPDGNRVITASFDKTAKIWDAKTGILLLNLIHECGVFTANFSNDGGRVVTACDDSTAKIWDAKSGEIIQYFFGHDRAVLSAQFSPDGKNIITASADSTVIIWNAITGEPLKKIRGHKDQVLSAMYSPDGKKIVTASWDKTSKIWDAASGRLLLNLVGHTNRVNSAQFSPDGKNIITASSDSTVIIWDANTGEKIRVFVEHRNQVFNAAFSPNGKRILTASADATAKVWEASTGRLLVNLKGHTEYVNFARFSPDEKNIITASDDRSAKIWDTQSGNSILTLVGRTAQLKYARFSPDGSKIVTVAWWEKIAKIWDVKTGQLLYNLVGHSAMINDATFSPDGSKLITRSDDSEGKIWDSKNGQLLLNLKIGESDIITDANFSADSKKALTIANGKIYVWDAFNGSLLKSIKSNSGNLYQARFSPDGNKVISPNGMSAKIWDVNTGILFTELRGHLGWVNDANFSPDGNRAVTASNDSTTRIWDVKSGKLLFTLIEYNGVLLYADYSADGNIIITVSADKTSRTWDAKNGQLINNSAPPKFTSYVNSANFNLDGSRVTIAPDIENAKIKNLSMYKMLHKLELGTHTHYSDINFATNRITGIDNSEVKLIDLITGKQVFNLVAIDSTDYFNQVQGGYYQSTIGAAKLLHYVTPDQKVITFEQLDVKYNRPDKVLQAMGNSDTNLINTYRRAYEKRIQKLGIDTTAFRAGYSIPEADFENRESINSEQHNETLLLYVKGNDATYALDRINVWVNEVPVFGLRGLSIRDKKTNGIKLSLQLTLSQGVNKIETSVTNVNGTESYHKPLIVNYIPAVPQQEITYFMGIGIDHFADPSYNLRYSTKDIRDLANKLKEKFGNNLVIDTLFNENVTVSNVKALKNKLLKTTVNDKVIISYSGHGLLSREYDYYLSTYAVNFKTPEKDGLAYDALERLLDSIPARKKLMLIDACHSGEIDKEGLTRVALNQSALDSSHVVVFRRGVEIIRYDSSANKLGLKSSFELMQHLFVNVGKSTGSTIISAAGGTEFALEEGKLKNGVFTHCILEAMENYPKMKVSELKKVVGARVMALTKGMQQPTSRSEAIAIDWNVW